MKRKILAIVVATAVLGILGTGVASATSNVKLSVFEDAAPGPVGVVDFVGPTVDHSFVNFNQDDVTGDLRIVVNLHKTGEPGATYQIFLVCGAGSHAGCGFDTIGTLTLNKVGNGNSGALIVPKCQAAALLGPGGDAGHVDLLEAVGDDSAGVYVADDVIFDPSIGPACP